MLLGYLMIVVVVGAAAAVSWLTRADRARWAATEKSRDRRVGSSDATSDPMAGGTRRIDASRVAIAAILLGSTAFLIYAWRVQHPSGLMSTDDSNYSTLAMLDWRGLAEHGLGGLFTELTTNGPNAPLVPLLAAPLTAGNAMTSATVLVQIPFMWLLIISSHSIYRRVTGPQAALVGTVVTAFLPGVLMYSRLVHFAVPLTAVLTAALAALLASRGLTSLRWTLVFGVLVGLALLTRTIALAMAPGLLVSAVVLAIRSTPVRVWVPNLSVGLAAAAVVAGPWYVANFSAVWEYLTIYGYDASSPFYAQIAPWVMRLGQMVGEDIFIPLSVVGIAVFGVSVVRGLFRRSSVVGSPILTIAAIVVTLASYFSALSSSHNSGTAFTLPLSPLLVALVLVAANQLGRRQAIVAGVVATLVMAVGILAAVVPFGFVGVGHYAVVDGRSASDVQIETALGGGNTPVSDPSALGLTIQRANCAIAARATEGPILNTRSDALLAGISYCAEGVYRAQAFIYNSGCAPTDGACVSGVISHFGFPTVITGIGPAPYPGFNSEDAVLPALTGYRLVEEIDFAPGVVVRVWARPGH